MATEDEVVVGNLEGATGFVVGNFEGVAGVVVGCLLEIGEVAARGFLVVAGVAYTTSGCLATEGDVGVVDL